MLPNCPIDLGWFQGRRVLLVPVADLPFKSDSLEAGWGPGRSTPRGYSYEDLANGVWHFQRRILPEILRGVPLDDLAARGPASQPNGLVDNSSFANLIPWFFGEGGLKVSWSKNQADITNGNHRIHLARTLGLTHMPVVAIGDELPKGMLPVVLAGYAARHSGLGTHFSGGGNMSGQTRVTPGELDDFVRKFQARARDIEDRLQSIRDGLRALGRTFDDPDFARFQENFERSSQSICEFTDFSRTEANRMLLMAEDARRKEQVAKGGA